MRINKNKLKFYQQGIKVKEKLEDLYLASNSYCNNYANKLA